MCPKLGPRPPLFKGRWSFHPSWLIEVKRVPGLDQLCRLQEWWEKWAPGASQEHLVRCIDFMKPLMSVLVLEIQRNMIYRVDVPTLYGILRTVYEAFSYSCTSVWVSEASFSLSSSFLHHHFCMWMIGCVRTIILHVNQQQPECFWIHV